MKYPKHRIMGGFGVNVRLEHARRALPLDFTLRNILR